MFRINEVIYIDCDCDCRPLYFKFDDRGNVIEILRINKNEENVVQCLKMNEQTTTDYQSIINVAIGHNYGIISTRPSSFKYKSKYKGEVYSL